MHISGNVLTNEMIGILQINGIFYEHDNEADDLMNTNIRIRTTSIYVIAITRHWCTKHIHRPYAIWRILTNFTIDRHRASMCAFTSPSNCLFKCGVTRPQNQQLRVFDHQMYHTMAAPRIIEFATWWIFFTHISQIPSNQYSYSKIFNINRAISSTLKGFN